MLPSTHWVFAYGSNMHLPDLRRWLHERDYGELWPSHYRRAYIPDHSLVWNYHSPVRDGAAANVHQSPGQDLHGLALRVNDTLLEALDIKEGHPDRYNRGETRVPTFLLPNNGDGGIADEKAEQIHSWLYTVQSNFLSEEFVPPRAHYLNLMVEAAKQHGLPDDYRDALAATVTKG